MPRQRSFVKVVVAGAILAAVASMGMTAVGAAVTPAEQTEILAKHNDLRRLVASDESARLDGTVTIPDLVWNDEAAVVAQSWAETLVATGEFEHNPGTPYGENIAWEWGPDQPISFRWAGERIDYDFDSDTCTPTGTRSSCGHYTQIVWADTTSVGCGSASDDHRTVWVCEYAPGGNITGEKPYRLTPLVEPPVVEPPVTEPPVVEPPVVEPPVVEPPVTEPPVVEPPVVEQ